MIYTSGFCNIWPTAICFVVGAIFSTLAGFFGMTVATNANVRTARCLTNEKQFYLENYPDIVVEKSGIDELILMEKKEK